MEVGGGHGGAAPSEWSRMLLPASVVVAAVAAAFVWFGLARDDHGAVRAFESEALGLRFEHPSAMRPGPNFVRLDSGSMLTIERHSLLGAQREFVEALPDALFPQVRIQLEESYPDVEEISRTARRIGGRPAIEVLLRGHAGRARVANRITVDIVATEEWVYVLRSYSAEPLDAAERPLFERVRETLSFLPSVAEPPG